MVLRVHLSRFCLLALCLVLCLPAQLPAAAAAPTDQAQWTFMVYMAADNNLEGAGIDDFMEMAVAGSDANLNIVVQFDRIPGYDTRYGDWRSTKRFLVGPGMTPTAENALLDIGEANMGALQTVIDFVDWGRATFPADHYALIFWNHGGGWLEDLRPAALRADRGVDGGMVEDFCWDDTNGGDAITSAELFQALDTTTDGGALPIDQVGFDACVMAMWEVDNQIKPFGSLVTVSSEENEPWDGWPYDTIMSDLKANPDWTPAELGYDIVERYYQSYGNDETLSAKDVSGAYTGLNQAVDAFAQALIAHEPAYHNAYNTARSQAQDFGGDFIDISDFALKIYNAIAEPDLDAAALAVMDAVDGAVINERHGAAWPGAHGIDFFFPSYLYNWTAYQQLRSSSITHWDEFVEYHVTGILPCAEAFVAGVDYSAAGLTVTFAPSVYGDAPLDYFWSFGDGQAGTEANPVHTYAAYDSYDVSLQVTNCAGAGQSAWQGVVDLSTGIVVQPAALEAWLAPGGTTTETLWIINTGTLDVEWAVHELSRTLGLDHSPLARPRAEPVVAAELAAAVRARGRAPAIVYLRELPDLSPAYRIGDRDARRTLVYERLRATAERSGGALLDWLQAAGAEPRALPMANAIAATLDDGLLRAVAARPEVALAGPDRVYQVAPALPAKLEASPETVEWNIAHIGADQAWSELGVTGEGVAIGVIDTGVAYAHAALVSQYRGNLGGGSFDHNYHWFDFVAGQPVPYDDNNHGTFDTGVAVGDDGGGNQIGVAPGARWIAAKACTAGGMCSQSDLLDAAFWMLAPYRLDGTAPDPTQAPDVVYNGWGTSGGLCDPWFDVALSVWRAAGILGIAIPGSGGPACGSVGSPANSGLAIAAGATDNADVIASFSPRGPSQCTGAIKPEVTAPGVNIRSSVVGGYAIWSGTASSTAHLAGTAALAWSANPMLDLAAVTEVITSTALCIDDPSCGGTPCPDGANNVYGWGRIDAYQAVSLALALQPYDLPWLSESPLGGTLAPGESVELTVEFDAAGLPPGVYLGLLDVESDDPETPHVGVPVTLTVEVPCEPVQLGALITEADGCTVTFGIEVTGTEPITYAWDFGPFGSSGEPDPTVGFGQSGTYTGSVEVWNCGEAGSAEQSFTVDVSCAPTCRPAEILSVGTDIQGCSVAFSAEVTGTFPLTYTWDFGPFGVWNEPAPVIDFDHSGTYSWTLEVMNCQGAGYDVYSQATAVSCPWHVYVPVVLKGQ